MGWAGALSLWALNESLVFTGAPYTRVLSDAGGRGGPGGRGVVAPWTSQTRPVQGASSS